MIDGVGPDAETVVNAKGGRQSGLPYRCDLLPAQALLHVARIFAVGAAKYGDDNWRQIPIADHINHQLTHTLAWGAGDVSDDHPGHNVCRALMALELFLDEKREAEKRKFGFGGAS